MTRHSRIRVLVVAIIATLLAACGKHDAPPADQHAEVTRGAETGDTVTISDEGLKLISIETVVVARGSLDLTLPAPGHASFNLNRTAQVSSTLEGRIVKMAYDVGASVHEGDVMVVIESPELLDRSLELKAPIGGEVIARRGTVGEIVDQARELYTISDPESVWIIADVSANDIAGVRVGQAAAIHTTAFPGEMLRGKVALVSPEVAAESRTVEVRIETDRPDPRLKPGMFVDVEIAIGSLGNVVAVPDQAVQRLGDQEIVFIANDAHTFTARLIHTGRAQSGRVEILDGLESGERVVTKGSFLLKSELLKSQFGE